ncbi:hypothetical protein ACAG96_03770 [Candidatus Izemoplasma sp. B36]|uniref:hypothetical protein n=1 Tax=Candidatus Izemoplasma sp. B36 TaxID=3242468 RepID=UPI0035587EC6
MKRKLISFMLLLMFTVFLTACDFGNQTVPTTEAPTTEATTQAPTTAAPTTEAPTTETPTTAVPTTTGQGQYFNVVFYDGDGTVLDTQSVLEGEAATNPGVPTRAATAQYTYTFSNWDQDYSNVIADMNILPVFTETLNYYTVTFYDGDGSILETQSIGYGMAATAPTTDPVKAPEGSDAYLFNDWDSDFSSISGDLNVNPIFTTVFNRNALLQMINMMFDPYDTEEMVDEMLFITETATEEDLYYMMNDMWGLYQELFSVRSGTELQDWYAATKAAGFDKALFMTSLYNAMTNGMTNDLNYATQEVADLTADLASNTQELADVQLIMLNFETEVANYCSTGVPVGLETDCQNYWDDLLLALELEMNYQYQLDQASWDNWEFNWYVYEDLIHYLDEILYYDIVEEDISEVDRLTLILDEYIDDLSLEDYDLFMPLLDSYEAYQSMKYDLYESDNYAHLEVVDLGGVEQVKYHLQNLLWGNNWDYPDSDPHYYGYGHYWFRVDQLENYINWTTDDLAWAEENLERLIVTVGFITDPTYETNIKDLMGTVYDALDAVILTIDDPMVDMMVDFAFDFLLQSMTYQEPDIYRTEDMDFVDKGFMDGNIFQYLTPENIEFFASRMDTTILAIYNTLDQSDFDNAKVLLLAYMEDMMLAEGVDPLVVADEIAKMGLLYDEYVGYFHTIVGEITSLLESVDNAKATAIVDLIKEQNFGIMTDIDITITVSQMVEILIGDDSFDVSTILQILADIYFDMDETYNPLPSDVLIIQTDIDTYVTDTLALFTIVAGYDSHNLSLAEVENVMTLMERVMMVPSWFDNGFATVADPIVPYGDYLFENFVWNFMDSIITDTEAISLFQGIFSTVDNETTYYTLRSIQQYLFGITDMRNFDDLQNWMGNIESFGFTQQQLTDYIMNFVSWYSLEFKDGTPDFFDEVAWIQQEIDYWTQNYNDTLDDINDNDLYIDTFVQAFDAMYQTDAAAYWQALKDGILLNREAGWYENELRWMIDGNEVDYLQVILENIIMNQLDPVNLALFEAEYNEFIDAYSYDEYIVELIIAYRPLYIENYTYFDDVLDPLLNIIDDANPSVYQDFLDETNQYIMYYDYLVGDLEWYEWEMMHYEEKLDRVYQSLEFINVIYDLFNDPINYVETDFAITTILDDLQNTIANTPAGSFELVEKFINFVMMMEHHDGPLPIDDLPFTAAEIYTFTQDLSALLKLRFSTLDSSDFSRLEAYILIVITEMVEDNDDIDVLDKPAEVAYINTLVLKYLGFLDDATDELIIILDGLTEADIQAVLDTVSAFENGGYTIYQQVVMVAQAIDGIYDPTAVDLDIIIEMFLEVYFDMEYGTYDPQDLADTQLAWNLHMNTIETLIATVALYDVNAIDPLDYPTLIELQQAVMHLGLMFEDPMDILSNPFVGYTFDMMYLDDIISEMFNEQDVLMIASLEDSFIDILGLTSGDYEALYYQVLGLGSLIRDMPRIESPLDLLKVYEGIKALGYTNAEIAEIVMNGVMDLLYPELGNMMDTTWLDNEIINLQNQINSKLADIAAIQNEVANEIDNVDVGDPTTKIQVQEALSEYFLAMQDEVALYVAYDQSLNYYSWNYQNFDWGLWNAIQDAIDQEEPWRIDEIFDEIGYDDYWLYSEIRDNYAAFINARDYADTLSFEYGNNFGYLDLAVSFDEFYPITNYIYNKAYDAQYIYMEIAEYERMIDEYQYEIDSMMNMAWLPETVEAFLDDPANAALTEQLLINLLDQIDAWIADPNLEVLEHLEMILKKGPAGLTIADLSTEIQMIGNLLTNMLSTVDAADEALLIDFAIALSAAYADTQYDPSQAIIMKAYFDMKISEILPEIIDVPSILGTYLLTFDETKTEAVFNTVIEMFLLCPVDPNRDVREIINVSGIIDAAFGDNSLDYELIVSPVVKFIFEVYTMNSTPPGTPVEDIIDEIVFALDDVLYYADIIEAYDPVYVSEAQWIIIEEFGDVLEDLFEAIGDFIR